MSEVRDWLVSWLQMDEHQAAQIDTVPIWDTDIICDISLSHSDFSEMFSSSLFSRCPNCGFEIIRNTEELKAKQAGARACKVLCVTKCCEICSFTLILDTWVPSASALRSWALHSWNTGSALPSPRGRRKTDELVFVRHTVTIAISSTKKLMRKVIAFHADSMQSVRHGDTLWTMKEKNTEQLVLKWESSILCTGCSKALWRSPVWP